MNLGCVLQHSGRFEEAEEVYRRVIELEPNQAWGWGYLGDFLHEHSDRYEEAEQIYRKALELGPEVVWGWIQFGKLLQNCLERYDEAEQAYRKVIKLEPQSGLGWAMLGQLFQISLERYDEAEQAYRKVIKLEPQSGLGWFLLGQLFDNGLERYEEAEKAYRKAIEFDPLCPAWKALIFLLQEKLRRPEEALELLREYLEDADLVQKTVDDAIEVFVALAAGGYGQAALEVLQDSAGVEILEPLVVGLQLFVGEDVKAAAEIMEVGKDVVKRIEEQREQKKIKPDVCKPQKF